MAIVRIIDPVPRIEGHLKVEVTIDTVGGRTQVTDARCSGGLFRGFERLLLNRPPADAVPLTQRICGVCPVSHGLAAACALENAAQASIPSVALMVRNLILGADYLHSHILHFYQLALLDFVDGPAKAPWQPSWPADRRITGTQAQTLVSHYLTALDMRRTAHQLGAMLGGRMPHPPAIVPGGVSTTGPMIMFASSRLAPQLTTLTSFIQDTLLPDVRAVANAYSDYYQIGVGPKNLLSFGAFDLDPAGTQKLMPRGRVVAGGTTVEPVDIQAITEQVNYAWYESTGAAVAPASADTAPAHPKTNAYSWVKAPRYGGTAYEVGPLARMWVQGEYRNGISVMDRHLARAAEALKIAQAMAGWANALGMRMMATRFTLPQAGSGCGLVEAPRGALGHWLTISGGTLARYQIIAPTSWNASPRDDGGVKGALEDSLIGTPIANPEQPIEVLRVVHSFDPCLGCAIHVVRPTAGARVAVVAPATTA